MKHFITDMGRDLAAENVDTGDVDLVPRYAVWGKRNFDGKAVVIEVSVNLKELKAQYGSDVPVYRIDELIPKQ